MSSPVSEAGTTVDFDSTRFNVLETGAVKVTDSSDVKVKACGPIEVTPGRVTDLSDVQSAKADSPRSVAGVEELGVPPDRVCQDDDAAEHEHA